MKIPKRLQPVLWSTDVSKLDLQKDKYYIIHQILIYGRMEEINWLFKNYSKKEIIEIFLQPYKNYPRFIFYFVKNYLLGCQDRQLNEDAYVTSISGPVKPRTPPGFQQA
ncbi:hypothetical protein HZA75_05770 [Candidatus Roizmanbacteria bacterium]|nr:hypothetical protein [Candidatus Roizmanbacteria bacterium]